VTREHKLALILGFAVILIVGVLVGDHFSRARQAAIGAEIATPTGDAIVVPVDQPTMPMGVAAGGGGGPAILTTGLPAPEGMITPTGGEPAAGTGEVAVVPVELKMGHKNDEPGSVPGFVPTGGGVLGTGVGSVPPAAGLETVRSPLGGGEGTSEPAPAGDPLLPVSTGSERRYVVEPGDSLYRIAEKMYRDGSLHKALAEYNKDKIPSAAALRVGVTLRVPPKDVLLGQARLGPKAQADTTPANVTTATPAGGKPPAVKTEPTTRPEATRTPAKPEAAARTYTVKPGDTLGTIAQRQLGTSKRWRELLDVNKAVLGDADDLKVGMTLRLPPR
jgi:nucleoid-associated protein YgaU